MQPAQNLQTLRAKLDGKIREWNSDADRMHAKAQQAGAEMQSKFLEHVETIRQKESEARDKLTEFGNATKSASEELKAGVDKAVTEFGSAVDKARQQFN